MANQKNIAATVRELLTPTATAMGYELWDVEFVREGARRVLRLTIDKPEGINIEDCEAYHRAVDPILDEADPIEEAYYLEVSSPGVERELRTPAHVEACEGWNVEVRLYAPRNGVKKFRGVLLPCAENGDICIRSDEQTLTFARDAVAKINTYFEF